MISIKYLGKILCFGIIGLIVVHADGTYDPCTHIRGENGLNFFESQHPSGEWVVMNCADGTVYNTSTCSCSDISYSCVLLATGVSNQFAYYSSQSTWVIKTCPYGTVYKHEKCGCFD